MELFVKVVDLVLICADNFLASSGFHESHRLTGSDSRLNSQNCLVIRLKSFTLRALKVSVSPTPTHWLYTQDKNSENTTTE